MITYTPALTIRQPWTWSITHQAFDPANRKPVENRGWSTDYRGPIWLHAGARSRWDTRGETDHRVTRAWRSWIRSPYIPDAPVTNADRIGPNRATRLMPFGAVAAMARLIDVHHASDCANGDDLCSVWAAHDQFHWVLRYVTPLPEPVPVHGQQRFWPLPEDVEAAARAQVPGQEVTRG